MAGTRYPFQTEHRVGNYGVSLPAGREESRAIPTPTGTGGRLLAAAYETVDEGWSVHDG